ncbi:hypothetical protein A2U01_0088875, partial [Trifolium medium]|nr:hypothetical protein [Trifolium medium]
NPKESSLPDVPPSSEIIPESPVTTEDPSIKNNTEDAPTSVTKGDLDAEQIMNNVAQNAVTSVTAEASKKDDSRDVPTSKENT